MKIDTRVPVPPNFSEDSTKETGIVTSIGKHDIAEGKGLFGKYPLKKIECSTNKPQIST